MEETGMTEDLYPTTTNVYTRDWIAPQWLFTTLNSISGTAVIINLLHIILMSKMHVGMWTAAKNFKAFVIYLAATDLILSGVRLSLNHHYIQEYMSDSRWLCVTSATVIHSINVYQTNLLALASLERFIAVCTGVNYSSKPFVRHYPKILGLFMVLWCILYIIIAILYHELGYSVQGSGACQLASADYKWLDQITAVAGLLNLIILILFYSMLLCKSKIMNRKLARRNSKRATISRRSARLNTTVGVLVVTKLVLWTPAILQLILRTRGIRTIEVGYVSQILIYFCSIANPILYGFTSSKYRKFLRATLNCQNAAEISSSNGPTVYSKGTTVKGEQHAIAPITTPDTSTTTAHSETDLEQEISLEQETDLKRETNLEQRTDLKGEETNLEQETDAERV